MSQYLSRIEGSPPKRNAVGSIPIWDAIENDLFKQVVFSNNEHLLKKSAVYSSKNNIYSITPYDICLVIFYVKVYSIYL